MSNTEPDMPTDGWISADFADPAGAEPVEDDPWSDPPNDARRTIINPSPAGPQLSMFDVTSTDDEGITVGNESGQTVTRAHAKQVADVPVDYAEHNTNDGVDDYKSSFELEDDSLGIDLELSLDELEEDVELLDEPEPLAEYDSELAEALYYTSEDTEIRPIDLRLDELISSIECATETQRNQIYALLSKFSSKRLSNWLKWLHDQEWIGQSLLLFLEFRDLWADTPQWWEYSVWSHWLDRWWFYSNPSVLSRDAAYEVIQQRLHCQPDEIIEESWFRDWDDLALWRHGFTSFASFVVFRAGLNAGEDWMSYLSRESLGDDSPLALNRNSHSNDSGDILDLWADRLRVWENDSPYRTYVGGPPLWFAVQDWYDPAEWHDHLGWAIN